MGKKVELNIKATMDERWVNDFCSMLNWMQRCGELGHSSVVAFYSDGDGDFRPKFEFDREYNKTDGYWAKDGKSLPEIEVIYDAGWWRNVDLYFSHKITVLFREVEYIKYTDELTNAVNKYNDNLESIAQRILNLKIEFNDKDIEVRNLYGLLNKLSVVNSVKSRKETERLFENVITEYGYMLEVSRDTGKLP